MATLGTAPELGIAAPRFSLPATDGKTYSLDDVAGDNGTVVAFICNHCPYVKAVVARMVADAETLAREGIGFVAISANDPVSHPEDFAGQHEDLRRDARLPVSLSLRREPGDRPRLRCGLHAGVLRHQPCRHRSNIAAVSMPAARTRRRRTPNAN